MSDMPQNTGAFHNIYETTLEPDTTKSMLHEGDESGEGFMQRFEVAPGIQITYNDLKMDSCFRPIRFEKDFLQINHCLEGCYRASCVPGALLRKFLPLTVDDVGSGRFCCGRLHCAGLRCRFLPGSSCAGKKPPVFQCELQALVLGDAVFSGVIG